MHRLLKRSLNGPAEPEVYREIEPKHYELSEANELDVISALFTQPCNRVRAVREARRLTRDEVAERAGMSPRNLADMENPMRSLRGATLRKLAAALDCQPRDLIA